MAVLDVRGAEIAVADLRENVLTLVFASPIINEPDQAIEG
jgi:hypothetical protein